MVFFFIAKTDNGSQPVSPADMDAFQEDKELMYDNVIIVDGDIDSDGGYDIWDLFVANNDYEYTYGIPMVYRKDMTIGIISGTYEWSEYPLSNINTYLAE